MRFNLLVLLGTVTATVASAQSVEPEAPEPMRRAAPALAAFTDDLLLADVWKRPGLSPRDRSLVTITALIATGKREQLGGHLSLALDNGVTAAEIGGVITHLAFYTGWPNAVSACEVADAVFKTRRIPASSLQSTRTALIPTPASDAARAKNVDQTVTPISPSLAQLTNGPLFGDLWRRSDLAPRDRSLVTIVALTANGDADQLGFHLSRGIENGLTRAQLGEAMAHLAFYAGWPKAFSGTTAIGKLDSPAKP
ncbi:carboxymuconolactone decarboxylase family protein [Sphingomonas sp. LB2R24]|uniref:carboxymuconolactone decarboxylase family protein n=1 Tax=Sphingomonas sorbitolis TaxID=3096165 RepID=UPI002FC93D01